MKTTGYVSLLTAGAFLMGCDAQQDLQYADETLALQLANSHAAEVYGHFQAASRDRVSFELETLQTGAVRNIADQPVQSLIEVPDYQIKAKSVGTVIQSAQREARDLANDEWSQPVFLADFEEHGWNPHAAVYQILQVRVNLDGQTSEHHAIQACWLADQHCVVMDPVVYNLEGFAADRAHLLAEGWEMTEELLVAESEDEVGIQANCRLNSSPSHNRRTLTWSGYTRTYKNLYGVTVVETYLGGQQTGISCYVSGSSCLASPFGYSNNSSCFANLGFNCDCENTGNHTGTSSNAARSWSESKCEHKNVFSGSANVSYSKSGFGANFSINWSTSGGTVDSNGGTLYDSCGWW